MAARAVRKSAARYVKNSQSGSSLKVVVDIVERYVTEVQKVFVFVTSLSLIVRSFIKKHKYNDKKHNSLVLYSRQMHRIKATFGVRPKELSVRFSALYLALFFVVASVVQLVGFEDFPDIIASYGLPIDPSFATVIAATIVSLEVLAVPFLLTMKLSPLMRALSAASGLLVLLFWLTIGLWQNLASPSIENAGLFGSLVTVPQGWWLVSYMVALLVLFGFTVWAMTPHIRRSRSKRAK